MGEGPEHNPFAPPAEHADFQIERVHYENYQLATYGQRFAGSFIDGLLYMPAMIPGVILLMVVGLKVESPDELSPKLLLVLVGPILLASYQWYLTAKTGQSFGKRWLRTRIVRDGLGTPPGFVHGVLLRVWLIAFAGFIPFVGSFVGLADAVAIFIGGRRQTLHDRVAQTIVIQE